jgi:probable phosphoglycerate mutase
MRHLYVVTHAQSQHHVEGVVGGWHDGDLSKLGQVQASRIAQAVRTLVPADAHARVYTSDLRRALQTAEPVAQGLGVCPEPDTRLREISYGAAEGRPQAWLDDRFVPAPDTAAGRLDHRFGLPDAESRREVGERVYQALDAILDDEREHQVVVTHAFALTLVVAAWQRLPLVDAAWISFGATPGGITHLQEDDRYLNRSVVFLNRTAHLAEG